MNLALRHECIWRKLRAVLLLHSKLADDMKADVKQVQKLQRKINRLIWILERLNATDERKK